MKLWYKSKTFRPWGDDGILHEMECGTEKNGSLTYPNVSTCTTVTVLTSDNRLVGTHLDKIATADDVTAIIGKMNEIVGNQTVTELCIVGVLREHGSGWMNDQAFRWPNLFNAFSEGLNHQGAVMAYVQAGATERHYRVARASGATVWFTKIVPQKPSGSGTASSSLDESRGVSWETLKLTKW